ncbi:MAG: TPM domain-containing protein, partial [Deltaproteobacteria bacterium]|nr:TPM domain-containing protein [Deltaproteobacteria bacterium]
KCLNLATSPSIPYSATPVKKSLLLLAMLLVIGRLALAAELPKYTGWVNDFAGVIDAEKTKELTALMAGVEQASGIEMAVVTIRSLEGEDIEGYAVRLFKTWGIGKKEKNNGLLILAAIEDHRARIEVGYGLEETINDAFAGRVLREVLFPSFQKGEYGEGLLQATQVLTARLANHFQFQVSGLPSSELSEGRRPLSLKDKLILLPFIILLVFLFVRHPFLFLLLLGNGIGGGRGSGSGGFGGGFGGFGGGMSGGGGSSGSW